MRAAEAFVPEASCGAPRTPRVVRRRLERPAGAAIGSPACRRRLTPLATLLPSGAGHGGEDALRPAESRSTFVGPPMRLGLRLVSARAGRAVANEMSADGAVVPIAGVHPGASPGSPAPLLLSRPPEPGGLEAGPNCGVSRAPGPGCEPAALTARGPGARPGRYPRRRGARRPHVPRGTRGHVVGEGSAPRVGRSSPERPTRQGSMRRCQPHRFRM